MMIHAKLALMSLFFVSEVFGDNTALEITSSTFTVGSVFTAFADTLAATEGQFFITNSGGIGGGGGSDVVGWVFPVTNTSSSALVEITDPNFTATISSNFSAVPLNVTAAEGRFFIVNNSIIGLNRRGGGASDVVGWVFPATSTSSSDLVEITSSTFSVGSII
jgi:hypothetical protein